MLCSVMPGLRLCELLLPNSEATCLPGGFCQWEVLMGNYNAGEGTSGCQLPPTALLPSTPAPPPPDFSLQLLSTSPASLHHQVHTESLPPASHANPNPSPVVVVVGAGAVWSPPPEVRVPASVGTLLQAPRFQEPHLFPFIASALSVLAASHSY